MLYCKALFVLLHHYFHIKLHFHWLSLRFCENMFVFSPIAILVFNILASRTECTFNPFFSFKTLIFSRIVFQLTLKNNPLHVLTDGGCSLCQIHLSMRFFTWIPSSARFSSMSFTTISVNAYLFSLKS